MVLEDRYASGITMHCLHCGERRLYRKRTAVVALNAWRSLARADAMNWKPRRGRPRKGWADE